MRLPVVRAQLQGRVQGGAADCGADGLEPGREEAQEARARWVRFTVQVGKHMVVGPAAGGPTPAYTAVGERGTRCGLTGAQSGSTPESSALQPAWPPQVRS